MNQKKKPDRMKSIKRTKKLKKKFFFKIGQKTKEGNLKYKINK